MARSPLAHLVELRWLDIAWIIKESESLGGQLSSQEWKFVPCHADLHVGNILTSEHDTWLIDWDTGRLAPRECDLLFFLGNGILGKHGAAEEAAFLSGYGEVIVSTELIRYYRLARVLEDLISFAQEGDEKWFLRQLDSQLLLDAKRSALCDGNVPYG
jgi:spectinomycin phosphotransferase